jgi:hypothetical protein
MTKVNFGFVGLSVAALILGGCASTDAKKTLDEKLTHEVQVKDRADLARESKDLIEKSNGLSAVQRTSLLELREATQKESEVLRNESIRLRAVLIQDVLSPNYNQAEVDLIKSRMKDLEHKRTALLFNTVDKANQILGHDQIDDKDVIVEQLMWTDRQRGDF